MRLNLRAAVVHSTYLEFIHRIRASLVTLLLLLAVISGLAQAQEIKVVPELTALVVDQANLLDADQKAALTQKLLAFEKAKGSQIAILTVPTTAPEDIFSFAQRAAAQYKLGRQGVGDGVLIVVAANDRKVWIYVMRHLEGAIPDLAAKRVIAETITPAFKQQKYAAGLDAGTTQLMKLIEGEALPAPKANSGQVAPQASIVDVLILVGALAVIGSGIAGATSRWLIAPPAGGIAAMVVYTMTSVLALGIGAGALVLLFILIFGSRSFQMATQRTSNNARGNDVCWGGGFGGGLGGGWGGSSGGGWGGSGGGWGGSGGGGDAGGGGAGGDW